MVAVVGKRRRLAVAGPIPGVDGRKTGLKHLPFYARLIAAGPDNVTGELGLIVIEVPLGKGALSLEVRAV